MDFINRVSGRAVLDSVFKFTDIDPRVQKHITKVYATLALTFVICAIGICINIYFSIGGLIGTLGSLGSLFWLLITPHERQNINKRYALLGACAFCQGLIVGPLVNAVWSINPSIVFTAAIGCALACSCFSAAALLAKRRSLLYLGGFLSSAITFLFILRMVNAFIGYSHAAFSIEIYGGLIVFLMYILVDTQVMIEKAYAGNDDHITAALDFFVDFMAVFVRILIILARKEEDKNKKRRN